MTARRGIALAAALVLAACGTGADPGADQVEEAEAPADGVGVGTSQPLDRPVQAFFAGWHEAGELPFQVDDPLQPDDGTGQVGARDRVARNVEVGIFARYPDAVVEVADLVVWVPPGERVDPSAEGAVRQLVAAVGGSDDLADRVVDRLGLPATPPPMEATFVEGPIELRLDSSGQLFTVVADAA